MIENLIKSIVEKYSDDNCIRPYRDDEEDCYELAEELENELENIKADFKIQSTEAFSSCAYDCDVLSVAWHDEAGTHLQTYLLETY